MQPLARRLIVGLSLFGAVSPALAQGKALVALIPTELSAGLGGVIEWNPAQASPDISLGLSKAWVRDQWIEPALEMGLGF